MTDSSKAARVGIEGVFYSLAHVPNLVRYGSKPSREIRANSALEQQLKNHLRSFGAATAYGPHQVYIGNIAPSKLSNLPKPWYDKLIEGATSKGRFGDLVDQDRFYGQLAGADQFNLVTLEEKWFQKRGPEHSNGKTVRVASLVDIKALCEKGALKLYAGERLVGAFEPGHAEDASLTADVLLENLAAKVTAAHSLGSLLNVLKLSPETIDFVISCSEEAVGDRYNRGGGNLGKAIAEETGCANASGSDTKAFCAGPLYAMVHGASLIQAGVCNRVAVVAGGSLAKLGMKFESHLKKGMPILEDVLGSFAVILSAAKTGEPCMRLDWRAFHAVWAGDSRKAMAESFGAIELEHVGMQVTDVERIC